MKKNIGGIVNLRWPLGAVVLVDVNKEASALREAAAMRIPVVALVDTNSDPSLVSYVIPGNDDAPRSIKLIVDYLEEATRRGQEAVKVKREEIATQEPEEEESLLATIVDEESEEEAGRKGNNKKIGKKVIVEGVELEAAANVKAHAPRPRVVPAPKKSGKPF